MIYGGTPYLNPVYACYESCAEDMKTDAFLDLEWTDIMKDLMELSYWQWAGKKMVNWLWGCRIGSY